MELLIFILHSLRDILKRKNRRTHRVHVEHMARHDCHPAAGAGELESFGAFFFFFYYVQNRKNIKSE